jgi:AcrR family transcriptional regulator
MDYGEESIGKPALTKVAVDGKQKRRKQQRAIDTRRAILEAALKEFAERGFEGASMRRIGDRAGLDFTLIAYHFLNKDALWRATAEHAFAQIQASLDTVRRDNAELSPADAVRAEFRALFKFTVEHTAFHHFILRENQVSSARLRWLIENILRPASKRILPQIRAAQAQGELIEGDPALVYYMLIGMSSVLSTLSGEIVDTIGLSLNDAKALEAYWDLIERAAFR